MKNRILLPLLVVLGALLLWVLSDSGVSQEEDTEGLSQLDGAEEVTSTTVATLPGVETPDPDSQRLEVETSLEALDLESGDAIELEDARPDGSVLVEVHLGLPEGMPRGDAHPFAGCMVHTQSWDTETHATEAFEAKADGQGVARFLFEGAVHLDWFRAELPARYGRLTAFVELHVELGRGTLYQLSLVASEAVRVTGRVMDLNGLPLAGVEVRAYQDGDGVADNGGELDEWYPGHYQATSGTGGWFEFSTLPAEEMFIGVTPGEWLQVSPDPPGNFSEGCSYSLEAGYDTDVGNLMVTRREVMKVTVVDRLGQPAPAANVEFHPQRFLAPRLMTEEDWEEQFENIEDEDDELAEAEWDRLQEEGKSYPRWPYSVIDMSTDGQGKCTFVGVGGTWRVVVRPRLGGKEAVTELTVDMPRDELTIQLPIAVTTVAGKVVSSKNGEPIESAMVEIDHSGRRFTIRSKSTGEFELKGVAISGPFKVKAMHSEYFGVTELLDRPATDLQIAMRPAAKISTWIVDQNGKRLVQRRVRLVRRVGALPSGLSAEEAAQWSRSQGSGSSYMVTSGTGKFTFRHLYPGEYEVALFLPQETGAIGSFGEAHVEERVWQTWTVSAPGQATPLAADLSTYKPASLVQYVNFTGSVKASGTLVPQPEARIEIVRGGRSYFFPVDGGGNYSFRMPAGKAQMIVTCPGFKDVVHREMNYRRGRYGQALLMIPLAD